MTWEVKPIEFIKPAGGGCIGGRGRSTANWLALMRGGPRSTANWLAVAKGTEVHCQLVGTDEGAGSQFFQ
jgi:hypothetical protein